MNHRASLIAVLLLACLFFGNARAQAGADSTADSALDLDRLLSDDGEDDLLTEEKPAAKPAADAGAAIDDVQAAAPDSSADNVGQGTVAPPPAGRRGPPPSDAGSDSAFAGPAVIEDGRAVNFAQNLKEYRSPRVAMLLSLLLPGLGQAYARSYIKAAAFGAAEVAAISAAVYFNSMAASKRDEAYRWADKRFNAQNMADYETRLREAFVEKGFEEEWADIVDSAFWADAAMGGKSPYFYESIRDRDFTPGWDDNEPGLELILNGGVDGVITVRREDGKENRYAVYNSGSEFNYTFYYITRVLSMDGEGKPVLGSDWKLGYSDDQAEYNSMMNKSNMYSDAVNYMFYAMLLNHIASAIDAGFTARAYNARLLGEDNSAWNRLSVEQRHVFTGSVVSPGLALRVKF
jgi:hypothetical protein